MYFHIDILKKKIVRRLPGNSLWSPQACIYFNISNLLKCCHLFLQTEPWCLSADPPSDLMCVLLVSRCFPAEHMLPTHARACQPATDAPRQPIAPQRCCHQSLRLVGSLKQRWQAARAAYRVASGQTVNTAAQWQRVNRVFPPQLLSDRRRAEETTTAESGLNCDRFKGLHETFSDSESLFSLMHSLPCSVSLSHPHRFLLYFIFSICPSLQWCQFYLFQWSSRNKPVSEVNVVPCCCCEGASVFRF